MKLYSLIILFISFIYINSYCEEIEEPKKKEDCNGKLSEKDKNRGDYCCFLDSREGKECIILTQNDYDNINDLIQDHRKENIQFLNCHSFYLKIGFLIILFLLF